MIAVGNTGIFKTAITGVDNIGIFNKCYITERIPRSVETGMVLRRNIFKLQSADWICQTRDFFLTYIP